MVRVGDGTHGWSCGFCETYAVGYASMAAADTAFEDHLRGCSRKRMLLPAGRP